MRRWKLLLAFILAAFCMLAAEAQLPPGNSLGVSTGHIHVATKDVAGLRAIWRDLGASEVLEDRFVFIKFPGIFLMINDRETSGPSKGSITDHLTFRVKDLAAYEAKLGAHAATNVAKDARRHTVAGDLPGGIRVEFREDKRLKAPIEYEGVQLVSAEPEKLQAWYASTFGGTAGRDGDAWTVTVPGGRVAIVKSAAALPGSKGRALDHIGFEVADVDAFAARLESQGITLDLKPTLVGPIATKILFFTDPQGTYIELTQGLRSK